MKKETLIRDWTLRQVGSPYVYGGTGQRCTPGLRSGCAAQYPAYAASIRQYCPQMRGDAATCTGCRYAGKACFDCAQLVRRALALAGQQLPSGASSQWRSDNWASKGPLDGEAARQFCVLFRMAGEEAGKPMQHVGLHLGDGRTVDARSHRQGVVLGQIKDYPWTHYAIPYGLAEEAPALSPGDRGERVRQLQGLLLQAGQALPNYGADGIFGAETLDALHGFLQAEQLALTDRVDEALMRRLALPPDTPEGPRSLEERLDALEAQVAALLAAMKGEGA
ncbi:MAG: NlpC/P60 family protein [Christensenellales bacterium]